ncbi:hypothetical protein GCM10027589_52640 [Actinocorallia lasiicapitis]
MSKSRTRQADDALDASPFAGDLATELRPEPRRFTPPRATGWLAAGIVAVAGFLGGVQAHKSWGGAETPAAGVQRPAFNGGGGFGGGRTIGTVTKIEGGYLYLKTADGTTVKVKTGADTKITISEQGKTSDLKNGSSLVVSGTTGDDGTLDATAITEGAAPQGGPGSGDGGRPPAGQND